VACSASSPGILLPDSNPYGRDGLAHSHSLSTTRRALRVAQVGVTSFINQFILIKLIPLHLERPQAKFGLVVGTAVTVGVAIVVLPPILAIAL